MLSLIGARPSKSAGPRLCCVSKPAETQCFTEVVLSHVKHEHCMAKEVNVILLDKVSRCDKPSKQRIKIVHPTAPPFVAASSAQSSNFVLASTTVPSNDEYPPAWGQPRQRPLSRKTAMSIPWLMMRKIRARRGEVHQTEASLSITGLTKPQQGEQTSSRESMQPLPPRNRYDSTLRHGCQPCLDMRTRLDNGALVNLIRSGRFEATRITCQELLYGFKNCLR